MAKTKWIIGILTLLAIVGGFTIYMNSGQVKIDLTVEDTKIYVNESGKFVLGGIEKTYIQGFKPYSSSVSKSVKSDYTILTRTSLYNISNKKVTLKSISEFNGSLKAKEDFPIKEKHTITNGKGLKFCYDVTILSQKVKVTLNNGETISKSSVYCYDIKKSPQTFSIRLFDPDDLVPVFVSPTDNSGSYLNRKYILINSSSNITNFKNQTISVYNYTNNLLSYFSENTTQYLNFSVILDDGKYFFNSTSNSKNNSYISGFETTDINNWTIDFKSTDYAYRGIYSGKTDFTGDNSIFYLPKNYSSNSNKTVSFRFLWNAEYTSNRDIFLNNEIFIQFFVIDGFMSISPGDWSRSYGYKEMWFDVNFLINDTNYSLYIDNENVYTGSCTDCSIQNISVEPLVFGGDYYYIDEFVVCDGLDLNCSSHDADTFLSSETRNVTIDTIIPQIQFIDFTDTNGSIIGRNSIKANVSVSDANLANFTLNIYNSSNDLVYSAVKNDDFFIDLSELWCYQETANISTSCGGLSTGVYNLYALLGNGLNLIDENWASWAIGNFPSSGYNYINYSIPENATNDSLWQVKDGLGVANLSVQNCSFSGTIEFRILAEDYGGGDFYSEFSCYDGAAWKILRNGSTHLVYEEAIWWKFVSPLKDGVHYFNATVLDLAGNSNSTETRMVTIDTTKPAIYFTNPTETSGSTINRTYILINSSVFDIHFANQTIYVYNLTGNLVNSTFSASSNLFVNISDLWLGIYYFNVTAYDTLGNFNSSETRNVTTPVGNYSFNSTNRTINYLINFTGLRYANTSNSSLNATDKFNTGNFTLIVPAPQNLTWYNASGNMYSVCMNLNYMKVTLYAKNLAYKPYSVFSCLGVNLTSSNQVVYQFNTSSCINFNCTMKLLACNQTYVNWSKTVDNCNVSVSLNLTAS